MGRPRREKHRRRRDHLWRAQSGLCHWWQKPMLHWNDLRADPGKVAKHGLRRDSKGNEKLKVMPTTLATIDHLRDRYHPERQVAPVNREQRWVLACWQCNTDRGNQRTKERPIEELWERSKSRPITETLADDASGPEGSSWPS